MSGDKQHDWRLAQLLDGPRHPEWMERALSGKFVDLEPWQLALLHDYKSVMASRVMPPHDEPTEPELRPENGYQPEDEWEDV